MTDTSVSPTAPCTEKTVDFNGHPTVLRVHGDTGGPASRPVVLHFHGGAFTSGTLDDGNPVARLLADAGALVVSIDYPLAPAHPFPAAIDVGHAALDWLQAQRGRRHAHGFPLFVSGEEAGGNLAAAVAMMARDRQPGRLNGQILFSPLLDPCMGSPSLREASIGVGGCPVACGWREYLSHPADISHPYAAPAAAVRLTGMPPALLVSFAGSPLNDDARRYAERLAQAGVAAEEATVAVDPRRIGAAWPAPLRSQLSRFIAAAANVPVTAR